MKIFFNIMIIVFLICYSFGFLFCPKSNNPPQKININTSYTINPVLYNNNYYTPFQIGNKIFLKKFNVDVDMARDYYYDSDFCPKGFKIPLKEDFESLIKQLGNNAYSVLTDPNGFDMKPRNHYITNTKRQGPFNKILMYIEDGKVKFKDSHSLGNNCVCKCMLD